MRIDPNFIYLAAIDYNPEQVICQVVIFLLIVAGRLFSEKEYRKAVNNN
jgi:hypothetical protein